MGMITRLPSTQMKYAHRLMQSVGELVLPEIPPALAVFLQSGDQQIVMESLDLVIQFMATFKVTPSPTLQCSLCTQSASLSSHSVAAYAHSDCFAKHIWCWRSQGRLKSYMNEMLMGILHSIFAIFNAPHDASDQEHSRVC